MTPEERGRWQRRLLAVTTMAKHDLGRAERQLTRFRDDWSDRGGVTWPGIVALLHLNT
jgi:hypothetical protein